MTVNKSHTHHSALLYYAIYYSMLSCGIKSNKINFLC